METVRVLTLITITGTFETDSGTVCLTRSGVLENGTETIEPGPVCGIVLDGVLYAEDQQSPFTYFADDDTASEPDGLFTSFQIQIDGAPVDEFNAVVPHDAVGGMIDLITLRETPL